MGRWYSIANLIALKKKNYYDSTITALVEATMRYAILNIGTQHFMLAKHKKRNLSVR